ncbi:MAG: recombinase family protein [Clostridium lundense]|nr:recombinase family protein [Clostridium lundense]
MKAAIYSRKSIFTGKGDSVENQVTFCKEYAEKYLENITEYLIYEDEGFSGGNVNRPEFQRLLKDGKAKKFDVLICYRLDRISRNVADFSTTLEMLQNNNIDFVSIKEQFDTTTPMGRAMIYISSVFAQLERETIAERVRDNMLQLAKSGRWLGGQCPLGFQSEPIVYIDSEMKERKLFKLSPIDEELEKVKMLYDKYLETSSIHQVQKFCLEHIITGKNSGQISSMSINDILRNPVYVQSDKRVFEYLEGKGINVFGSPNGNGMLTYNKVNSKGKLREMDEWIAAVGKHKGIISSEEWIKVQEALDKNKSKASIRQGTSKKSLLSGVLKCGKCGAPMRISYGRSKKDGSDRVYYYMCTLKAHSGKTRCDNPNVRGDALEEYVVKKIKSTNTEEILTKLEEYKKEAAATTTSSIYKKLIDEIENKNIQMNNLINQLSSNPSISEFIIPKIEELGKEIKDLKEKLLKAENETISIQQNVHNVEIIFQALNEFNDTFDSIEDISKKRMLLEALIDKITYNGDTKDILVDYWGSKKK